MRGGARGRGVGLWAALVLFAGCPEDPTRARPLGELKPQSGPAPRPEPKPPPKAPEPEQAPVEETKYTADAAPVRFTLGEHHRASLSQLTPLPEASTAFEVTHWPVLRYTSGADQEQGRSASLLDWSVLLYTLKNGRLEARPAAKKEKWPGGRGWLVTVLDGSRSSGFEKVPMAFHSSGKTKAKKSSPVEVVPLAVDSVGSFRVRSLEAAKAWTLTITAQGDDPPGPVVLLAPELLEGAKQVTLDGKPLVRHTAALMPGRYRLAGARALWMTVPTVDGLKLAPLEVELSAAP